MTEIRPFRGYRYDPAKTGDLGGVLSPPYDVISPEEQEALYRRSPYNAVRVELPKTSEGDPYESAAATLHRWQREGALARDPQSSLYLAHHEFTYQGRSYARTELTAALQLEELGHKWVRPHEKTRAKAKEDRLRLLKATKTNISPVMLLCDQPLPEPPKGMEPALAELGGGERFLAWRLQDTDLARGLRTAMEFKPVYVADGHHRYETAVAYFQWLFPWADEATYYVMATLISFSDPGLLCLPYHRVLGGLDGGAMERLRRQLEAVFTAERVPMPSATPAQVGQAALDRLNAGALLAVWGLETGCLTVLALRTERTVEETAARGHSRAWASLSTAIFRETLLKVALGFEEEEEAERRGLLSFSKDAAEAIQRVNTGQGQVAFLCRAVPLEALRQVSDAGERLPPKSTFFYPKLPTGLVFKSLEGEL